MTAASLAGPTHMSTVYSVPHVHGVSAESTSSVYYALPVGQEECRQCKSR